MKINPKTIILKPEKMVKKELKVLKKQAASLGLDITKGGNIESIKAKINIAQKSDELLAHQILPTPYFSTSFGCYVTDPVSKMILRTIDNLPFSP